MKFVLNNTLIHYDGDAVDVLWNPNDVIQPDLVNPAFYFVDIEIYWYNNRNSTWNFFQTLARGLSNTGKAVNLQVFSGPSSIEEYIVPIVFRVVPRADNFSLIPNFLQPFLERREIGIWSSYAFKVTRSGQQHLLPGLCQDQLSLVTRTADDITFATNPCPCNRRQARQVNSGVFELRSPQDATRRSVFNPDATNCFVSISLGYVRHEHTVLVDLR